MLTVTVVIRLRRGVKIRDWRRPMQQAASPPLSLRRDWRIAIRIGPVVLPTLTLTLVIVPVPGTTMASRVLKRAPLVVKLHDGTRLKNTSPWQLTVLLAARLRLAPKSRAWAAGASARAMRAVAAASAPLGIRSM